MSPSSNNTKSRHQARLAREMSRGRPKSVASSTGSNHGTVSPDSSLASIDFNPERDEAICSTLQLNPDFSHKLPELRDTAKKYGRWAPRSHQDNYVINTSVLGRAFPDFSQGGSSPDNTFSLELPRGRNHRNASSQQDTSAQKRAPLQQAENSFNFESPVVNLPNGLRVMHTPKRGQAQQSAIAQEAMRNSIRVENATPIHVDQKENIPPTPQHSANGSPYVSNASRNISGDRRTLAGLHARVADDSDGSIVGDRPASVTYQSRSARFGKAQPVLYTPNQSPAPKQKNAPTNGSNIASNTPQKMQNASNPTNPTQRSFVLASNAEQTAHIPSGEFPIYVQQGMVHAGERPSHGPVGDMTTPTVELDIYQLAEDLKAQVAQLQMQLQISAGQRERESAAARIENNALKNANEALRVRVEQATSETEESSRHQRMNESRLQQQVEQLQSEKQQNTLKWQQKEHALKDQIHQLSSDGEETTRELRKHETTFKNELEQLLIESEENSRVWKRKEAELHHKIEDNGRHWRKRESDLKFEIEELNRGWLKRELDLKNQIDQLNTEKKEMARDWELKEFALNSQINQLISEKEERETKIQRNKETIRNLKDLSQQLRDTTQTSVHMEKSKAASAKMTSNHRSVGKTNVQKQTTVAPSEQNDESHITQEDSFENTQLSDANESNFSSEVGHGFMADLRQAVRDAKANGQAVEHTSHEEDTIHTTRSGRSSRAASIKVANQQPVSRDDTLQSIYSVRSRAPSIKGHGGILKNSAPAQDDLTGKLSIKSTKSTKSTGHAEDQTSRSSLHRRHRSQVEEDHATRSNGSHRRHHSESTVHVNHRRQDADDMTSAYLVADIDAAKQHTGKEHPTLSANARRVLDGLCKHNCKNCTICLRLASFDSKASKKTVIIEKPVLASKRAQSPIPYEEEPTLRPATAPGIALATVIKSLNDEIAHLKIEQTRVQAVYAQYDVSVGKRGRQALKAELDNLLEKIELKSDQVYNLYDVLEGQAQAGQEMSQNELDVTLQEIGVDLDELDIDEDLPWEGIEETQ